MQIDTFSRLFWHSRRGMLELDLLLVPFYRDCYRVLSPNLQQRYQALLKQEDTDLFAWCVHHLPAPIEFQEIIRIIKQYARERRTDNLS